MSFSIVVAHDKNRTIGSNGVTPWDLPEEMRLFTQITKDHPVIMGRKTWDSLKIKPLPNRMNLILSKSLNIFNGEAQIYKSFDDLVNACKDHSECMIIGGGEIYKKFLPIVDKVYLTVIDGIFGGDTVFPELVSGEWENPLVKMFHSDESNKQGFNFYILKRA